jgi:hypothetical protein
MECPKEVVLSWRFTQNKIASVIAGIAIWKVYDVLLEFVFSWTKSVKRF